MARMQLYLLGSFKVVLDGQPLTKLRSDKTRALLAYLAVKALAPYRRESLAALLWGEHPEKAARASLRVSLSNLRQALMIPQETGSLVEITRKHVQLNSDADLCWSDVAAFDALLAACQAHPHSEMEHCPACIQRLAQAVDLYRGDFLQDLLLPDSPAFDEWRLLYQETYHRRAMDIFETLATYHTSLGNYTWAQDYARRQIAMEPWREQAHMQLMRVLALGGQRSVALAQYETCRHILADELGVEPSAETVAVYEQIRAEALQERSDGAASIPVCSTGLHNFPARLTPFVGREKELAQIVERLGGDDVRLLTLVGSGGIGKTRLALQAAGQLGAFRDGAYYVPLAAVHAPASMAVALAQALQIPLRGDQDPRRQLLDYLGERQSLLVLDNMEHLRDGGDLLLDVLNQSPGVKILVTSRERLDLPGEAIFLLEGLDFTDRGEGQEATDCDAVQLFLQSAHRAQPDFVLLDEDLPAVMPICRLVDGTPLAIELAAAWVQVFSCRDIAQQIERDLDFLTTTLPIVTERHRSLRTVIDHSWRLLSAQERDALSRLSVSRGGLDGEAAWEVAGADLATLAVLVDKSLLHQESYGDGLAMTRYTMHNLLQQYAAERLAQDPDAASDTQDRHSDYFLRLLEVSEGQLKGNAQRQAMEHLWIEVDNVRAAWAWAVDRCRVAQIASALNGLFLFYELGGLFHEGEATFEALVDRLADARTDDERLVLGRATACQWWFAFRLGRQPQAKEMLQHSLVLLDGLDSGHSVTFCLNCLIKVSVWLGEYDEALHLCQQSLDLCQQIGDSYGEAVALNLWGLIAERKGDYQEARERLAESLDIAQAGQYGRVEADSLRLFGATLYRLGDYTAAARYQERVLHFAREIGDRVSQAALLNNLGHIYLGQGNSVDSRACFEEALHISRELGDRLTVGMVLNSLGRVASFQGDFVQSAVYNRQSLDVCREIGDREGEGYALGTLGVACQRWGDFVGAMDNYERALDIFSDLGTRQAEGAVLAHLGLLYHQLGDDQAAYDCSQRARDILQSLGARRVEIHAQVNLGRALEGLGRGREAGDAYRRAAALRRELGQEHLLMEPLAGLARLHLAQGETDQAQARIDEVLELLASYGFDGVDDPASLYLTCYDVLQASGDPRVDDILAAAYDWLQACAARIDDDEMRRAFLEDVAAHRDLIAMWAEASGESD